MEESTTGMDEVVEPLVGREGFLVWVASVRRGTVSRRGATSVATTCEEGHWLRDPEKHTGDGMEVPTETHGLSGVGEGYSWGRLIRGWVAEPDPY